MDLRLGVLLRGAWVAGTLPILVASIPVPRLRRFHRIMSSFANRGKTSLSSSQIFTVPHKYFLHFYMVAVTWTTCFLVLTWFYAYRKTTLESLHHSTESLHHSTIATHLMGGSNVFSIHKNRQTDMKHMIQLWRTVFVLVLMEAQVLRRLYESLSVFSYNTSARMHIFAYLTGLFSFAVEVFTYTASQINEFIIGSHARMPVTDFAILEYMKPLMKLGWCQWTGAAIFLWGWIHQYVDEYLGTSSQSLRRLPLEILDEGSLRNNTRSDEYLVPHGDWFETVSCAHYLAEIVIYAGILVATGGLDVTVWFLFGFVVANLTFAAAETHHWYRQKFDHYPSSRNAIFPLIY